MSVVDGVRCERLDNGLTVLMREMHHAPVASFWIWYRVGGRLERRPHTGLTHWVEHMLFRGTEAVPGASVHQMVARVGGRRNGFTSNDYTAYFETLPAEHIDLALRLEADRMRNARFAAEDVEAERTVILSERAGRENSARYRLQEALLAAAFPDHGYGHPVIGYREDLQRITRSELQGHYSTYYGPDNAVAVVTGDFAGRPLLDRIRELFGPAIAAGSRPRPVTMQPPAGPVRQGRVHVTGDEPNSYVHLLFPAVPAAHADYFPLLMLDAVLGGAQAMGPSGRGRRNRSSRLYRRLVSGDLAAGAGSSMRATVDPFAFGVGATARPDVAPQEVEEAIWQEIRRVRAEPVAPGELERARRQTRAQLAYSTESVSNQGYWLGFSQVVANLAWFLDFSARLSRVTAADVQRVATTYLLEERATVGWYTQAAG
jgi:zinc protease